MNKSLSQWPTSSDTGCGGAANYIFEALFTSNHIEFFEWISNNFFFTYRIKLYSVAAFLEKGKQSRMVVPHHWVDKDINVLSFPKKDISIHVMKWAKPAPDWKEYEITKLLLELGTKARCDEFEKNYVDSTQTDSEVDWCYWYGSLQSYLDIWNFHLWSYLTTWFLWSKL